VATRFRFGEFEFDPENGELRRDGAPPQRLQPQPARLLRLLADRRGAMVTRDEIRDALWPDTHVDFDASLHFCIRQLRSALGDSATDPRYIQNVPRRGYQLMAPVSDAAAAESRSLPMTGTGRFRPRVAIALVFVLAAVSVAAFFYGQARQGEPVRIAIMPFEPPIAESVLAELSQLAGDSVGIVGPTTTTAYAGSDADFRRLAREYRLDYIVNGRPLRPEAAYRLLVEVIRVSDGVHVWVGRYADLADSRSIGREISQEVVRVLALAGR
jgi:DNA-binding winged helix-turn-helix (wHTH) protein/TolB-like protein